MKYNFLEYISCQVGLTNDNIFFDLSEKHYIDTRGWSTMERGVEDPNLLLYLK